MKVLARSRAKAWICTSCASKGHGTSATRFIRHEGTQPAQGRSFATTTNLRDSKAQRDGKLPDYPARTRFAPSPTGYMHIGGLRTALFSYLLAKRTGGQFILRIEDTDQKRLVSDAVTRLSEDLRWAGLQWDEGPEVGGPYGPYQQSDRNELYQQHAQALLDDGMAYRCFCTPQSSATGSTAYATSGCYQDCSRLQSPESKARAEGGEQRFTVRLNQPDDVRKRTYPDLIYGNIKRLKRSASPSASTDEDSGLDGADTILVKSDGTPTYHFANVVDDHLMKITHVIRGTEWMASTPLHYDLYHAFGWQPPIFAHVGLLLDKDKAKLSKRNADLALDVRGLREDHGVLPETLCNFLALQGWSNPRKSDVMTMPELVEIFDLKFTRGNTMVLMEKLWFLQKNHVQLRCDRVRNGEEHALDDVLDHVVQEVEKTHADFVAAKSGSELAEYCKDVLLADDKSYRNAAHFVERNWYFFCSAEEVKTRKSTTAASELVPAVDIASLLQDFMSIYDATTQYVDVSADLFCKATVAERRTTMERSAARIHAFLNLLTWQRIASAPIKTKGLPFADQATDVETVARSLVGDADAGDLVKEYKTWQKALMRHLRWQLAAGTPGPGMDMVMAVLGHRECCRRLGITPEAGKERTVV
ncbi:Glutamate--tRNA ligase mitochondrial [Oleoguttula sp. CCFEE 5521]